MPTAEYELALQIAEKLSPEERARLALELATPGAENRGPRRSILELDGLGKEIWEGVDAQEYVNAERATWER
jgi:hypothetical protein